MSKKNVPRKNLCTLSMVSQWEGFTGSQWELGCLLEASSTELWGRPAVSTRYFHTEKQPNDGENYPRRFWGPITERPKRPPVGTLRNIFEKHIVGTKITDSEFHRIVSLHLFEGTWRREGWCLNKLWTKTSSSLFLKFSSLFRADEKTQPGSAQPGPARPPSGVIGSLVRSQGTVASNGGALHFVSRPQETGKQKLLLHAVPPNPQPSPVA